MTRARCIALAVLIGACWMGQSHAYAQGSPDYSGYAVAPVEALPPGVGPSYQNGANLPQGGYPGGPHAQPGGFPGDPYGSPEAAYGGPPGDPYGGLVGDPNGASSGPGGAWYGEYQNVAPEAQVAGRRPLFDGSYLRVDYLNWTVSRPGAVLLGAPIKGVPDPSQTQSFFDSSGALQAVGFVPTLDQIQLKNLNGIRGTLGTDLYYGDTVEVSAFLLNRGTSSIEYDQLFGTQFEVLTSTFKNNNLATNNNLFAYNRQFKATYSNRVWGAEANYIFDNDREGVLQFRPMIGARFLSFHEGLTQEGIFSSTTILEPDTISTIDAVTYNQLYGGQIGFRSEFVTKYLVLGFEPKYALMGNAGSASVTTNHFRSNQDPVVSTQENFNVFSSIFDVGAYGRVNITPNFSLRLGYNFMFITRIARPGTNIYYNEIGPQAPPAIVVHKAWNDVSIQGMTLGAEFRY